MIPQYLDTRQLEVFVAVISTGSMTGAAKALGKSQPVVTRLIQELEQEIGFALLHRNGPRIAPTEQGIAFFAQAELFLSGLRTISERARHISQQKVKAIEIASIPSIAASILPHALAALPARELPDHVHLQTMASENVVQAVVARTADIGIVSLPVDNTGLDLHWVAELPCVAVVSETDDLAGRDRLSLLDLRDRRLIASANPYRLRLRIDQAFAHHGVPIEAVIDSNATYVSLSLARAGLGVAIVESATLWGLPVAGVKIIPLDFRIPFSWGVVTAIGLPLSSTTKLLLKLIEDVAATVPGFVCSQKS